MITDNGLLLKTNEFNEARITRQAKRRHLLIIRDGFSIMSSACPFADLDSNGSRGTFYVCGSDFNADNNTNYVNTNALTAFFDCCLFGDPFNRMLKQSSTLL